MAASGKVAIAHFVLRNKENLAAIRSDGKVLTLTTMRFADEVVPAAELEIVPEKAAKPAKREQEMAEQLIESLSTDFEPSAYNDEYREQLLALIERKAEGKEIVASDAEAPKATKSARPDGGAGGIDRRGRRPQGRGEIQSRKRNPRPNRPPRRAKKRRRKRPPKPKQKPKNRPPKIAGESQIEVGRPRGVGPPWSRSKAVS